MRNIKLQEPTLVLLVLEGCGATQAQVLLAEAGTNVGHVQGSCKRNERAGACAERPVSAIMQAGGKAERPCG